MKVKRQNLVLPIESIIANGVMQGEEVDITAKKILDLVWPVIDYLQESNIHEKPELLK